MIVSCPEQGVHENAVAMWRISNSPVPYPYVYILNVTTFFFVYATPFLYASKCAGEAPQHLPACFLCSACRTRAPYHA
jgi:hypothetical protein